MALLVVPVNLGLALHARRFSWVRVQRQIDLARTAPSNSFASNANESHLASNFHS